MVAFVGEVRTLKCACGATREAPVGLRYLSCVRCGRGMAPATSNPFAPSPSRSIVAGATFVSQLLGMLGFVLALVWTIKHGGHWMVNATILSLGALVVFAGGHAHRGSVGALVVCAVLDMAVAIACLANIAAVDAFVRMPTAWALPAALPKLHIATTIAGGVALLAASACMAALPQTRRFAAWRERQILIAAGAWRG